MFGYRLTTRILFLALLVLALWALFARPSGAAGEESTVRVEHGDTLWSIASEAYGGDPREGVWKLARANGLETSTITVGQVLVVPG